MQRAARPASLARGRPPPTPLVRRRGARLTEEDDPDDTFHFPLVFTWTLPPLPKGPDLLVLATELAGVGGPDLPLEVSAIDSFASVTDARAQPHHRRPHHGFARRDLQERRATLRHARSLPRRQRIPRRPRRCGSTRDDFLRLGAGGQRDHDVVDPDVAERSRRGGGGRFDNEPLGREFTRCGQDLFFGHRDEVANASPAPPPRSRRRAPAADGDPRRRCPSRSRAPRGRDARKASAIGPQARACTAMIGVKVADLFQCARLPA